MEIRHSTYNDIESIMTIIKQAQAYFKSQGIDQWQNNYPNPSVIENDINLDESYVILMNQKIVGTYVLSFRNECTYDIIYDGNWLTLDKYAVIHRIAFDQSIKGQGLSKNVLDYIYTQCIDNHIYSIKIDTHEDNSVMRKMLVSNGFIHCGTILLKDGNKRLAYEKRLK
jgi:GNAT superfamily N-acetyltransferase